ncbi:unnamed protein product [Dicrocoelium dendriticum]|nr:unnamed protein product [Dicrocoelium dendriticum]
MTFSAPVLMAIGVSQGSVLGPVLFNVFINDLPSTLQADCLIYADDLKLWTEVSSLEDADRLQTMLDLLHDWSIKWQLPINRAKCSVLPLWLIKPIWNLPHWWFLAQKRNQREGPWNDSVIRPQIYSRHPEESRCGLQDVPLYT